MVKVQIKTLPVEGGEVALEMHVDGEPLAHMIVDAGGLSGVISDLAKYRATMADEVAKELDPGFRLEAVGDPIWRMMASEHGPILALRHPGLGWVSFLFPPHEAEAIARCLQQNSGPQRS